MDKEIQNKEIHKFFFYRSEHKISLSSAVGLIFFKEKKNIIYFQKNFLKFD